MYNVIYLCVVLKIRKFCCENNAKLNAQKLHTLYTSIYHSKYLRFTVQTCKLSIFLITLGLHLYNINQLHYIKCIAVLHAYWFYHSLSFCNETAAFVARIITRYHFVAMCACSEACTCHMKTLSQYLCHTCAWWSRSTTALVLTFLMTLINQGTNAVLTAALTDSHNRILHIAVIL